ncbi:MAG: NUMOD4 domain-containing protein [Bacteroidales bacterium]
MKNDRRLRKIDDEIWREIPFTDRKYEISNYGRIRSYCYDKNKGRILRLGNIRGFANVSLRVDGKAKSYLVHKITADAFVPKANDDQSVVIHLDWNKQNNHFSNLQWVTKDEAYKRMFRKFLDDYKKSNKVIRRNTKLKPEDVILLKSMLKKGVKQNIIAKLFCISEMQVTRIKRNENWGAVQVSE